MKTSDLILIKSQKAFDGSITSFYDKWAMATVTAMAMATAMATPWAMATAGATGPAMAMVRNKETNETIKLKYYGHNWKNITFPFIGIIAEIIPERDHDLDIFKIYHNNGYFYCRRSIVEGSVK